MCEPINFALFSSVKIQGFSQRGVGFFPKIGKTADKDLCSSPMTIKSVECGMISAFLNQGWTWLENGEGAPVEANEGLMDWTGGVVLS